jgi:hypothetical protein
MKKSAISKELLLLLVRVYNQSIQCYYYFPDEITCGRRRLEAEEFQILVEGDFLTCYHKDSFGKTYYLSQKGRMLLEQFLIRRKKKSSRTRPAALSLFDVG